MKKSSGLVVAWLLMMIGTLLLVIQISCFNLEFFEQQYIKNNVTETTNLQIDELMSVTEHLLGYIQDDYESLDMQANFNDGYKEVFTIREKDHMVDVKILYENAMLVKNVSFVVAIAIFVISVIGLKCTVSDISKSYFRALLVFGGFAFAIVFFALVDFDAMWTMFHHIFFNNDLWLLDPRHSVMINMVPLEFFYSLVMRISLTFIGVLTCVGVMNYFMSRRIKHA